MLFRARPLPLTVFAFGSACFMWVYFDRFTTPSAIFTLLVCAAAGFALVVEIFAIHFLGPRIRSRSERTRWLLEYGLASLAGSTVLIGWLEWVGLTQDRAPYVLITVYITRMINIWLIAYALDQVEGYRKIVAEIRAELLPDLYATQRINDLVASATAIRDENDRAMIRENVWRPLRDLQQSIVPLEDEDSAEAIDAFVGDRLRPLAHKIHPITLRRGMIPALQSLGFDIRASPRLQSLDAAGDLLDESVRAETFRWIQDCVQTPGSPVTVELEEAEHALTVEIHGAQCAELDALHRVTGLTRVSPTAIRVPTHNQDQEWDSGFRWTADDDQPPDSVRGQLSDNWAWSLGSVQPPIALVIAVTIGVAPSVAFIAQPTIGTYSILVPVAWLVIPLALALLLRLQPGNDSQPITFARFVVTWIVFGVASGIAVASLEMLVLPETGPGVWIEEMARGLFRLTLLGGLVVLAAQLARNAQRSARRVTDALEDARGRRISLLVAARMRTEAIAQLLHRTVQGRMAAIALMFRSGQRERAQDELRAIISDVLPGLIEQLPQDESARVPLIDAADLPSNLQLTVDLEPLMKFPPEGMSIRVRNIIGEAATNAVRHGAATTLHVAIREVDNHLVVTCIDNGAGLQGAQHAGLGSRFFDEAVGSTGSWSLKRHGHTTVARFCVSRSNSIPQRERDPGAIPQVPSSGSGGRI